MAHNFNYDKYLDYLKSTQRTWRLYMGEYPKTAMQYKATFQALKESTTVERLKFLYSTEHREGLIDALKFNTSLKILEIHGLHEADEAAQVLYALTAKQQLVYLNLHDSRWTDLSFKALLSFVNNNKTLQSLLLPRSVWAGDQLKELFVALKTCPNLSKIHLGDLYVLEPATLLAPVVEYLNSTPAIQSFNAELDAVHVEFLEKGLVKPLREYQRTTTYPSQVIDEDEHKLTLEGTALCNFWDTLPTEISKHILYEHTNIRDITRFISCSKVTIGLTRRWKLWKEYYLKHFSCVTAETLDLINFMEGWALLNETDINKVWPKDPWQLILKYTFTAHAVKSRDFPRERNPLARRLMEPVYQLYPQLIGCASATYQPKDGTEEAFGISNPSIHYTWFGSIASHTYSLGFELLRDGTINAIMIYHFNTQDSTKEAHWNFLHYVFDWFTAKSTAEFQTKLKPLVEILLTAQESTNYHCWPSKYADDVETISQRLKDTVTSVRTELDDKIIAEAKSIAVTCNPNHELAEEFAEVIYARIDRVKQCTTCVVPDYISLKQKITPKTEINQQWANAPVRSMHYPNIGENSVSVFNSNWRKEVRETGKNDRFRPKKRSGPTAITILIRTVLNVIVMPLLKSFWPQDMADPNYRIYPHFKDRPHSYEDAMYQFYQKFGFKPLEHVSVSHAQPQAWPVIAVAVARLIISPLCRVIETVIDRTWTRKQTPHHNNDTVQSRGGDSDDEFKTRLDTLIGGLTRIGLIPHDHITMVKKLLEELSK